MEHLELCKKCGVKPKIREDWFDFPVLYRFECPECTSTGEYKNTTDEAAKAWNSEQELSNKNIIRAV